MPELGALVPKKKDLPRKAEKLTALITAVKRFNKARADRPEAPGDNVIMQDAIREGDPAQAPGNGRCSGYNHGSG